MASERIDDALDAFVRSKQKGTDSGNYQRNARRVIEEWIAWLSTHEDSVRSFDQLQIMHMRQYARHLKERVDEGALAGSTATTYWNYIAAFLGWCVYEELVVENPARTRRAEEELPDKRPRGDRQQFWSRDDREALLNHLNERAYAAVDEKGLCALKELRDRALAALLADLDEADSQDLIGDTNYRLVPVLHALQHALYKAALEEAGLEDFLGAKLLVRDGAVVLVERDDVGAGGLTQLTINSDGGILLSYFHRVADMLVECTRDCDDSCPACVYLDDAQCHPFITDEVQGYTPPNSLLDRQNAAEVMSYEE